MPGNFETQNLEFKESWRDEYLRTICAFANSTGGRLVIGKDDNGNPVGLKNTKRLLEENPSITRKEMAAILGLTLEGVRYHLQKLKAVGRVFHIGPARAGRWQIKK